MPCSLEILFSNILNTTWQVPFRFVSFRSPAIPFRCIPATHVAEYTALYPGQGQWTNQPAATRPALMCVLAKKTARSWQFKRLA